MVWLVEDERGVVKSVGMLLTPFDSDRGWVRRVELSDERRGAATAFARTRLPRGWAALDWERIRPRLGKSDARRSSGVRPPQAHRGIVSEVEVIASKQPLRSKGCEISTCDLWPRLRATRSISMERSMPMQPMQPRSASGLMERPEPQPRSSTKRAANGVDASELEGAAWRLRYKVWS